MRQTTNTVEVRGERASYRVDAVLSRSDGVSVYQVRRADGEQFAMKLLDADDAEARRRFDDEARLGARLHHPSVVRIRDQGLRGTQPFLIMELVEGRTLADLARKGRLSLEQGVRRLAELARVMHAVHEGGVVHQDLQPGHVIVSDAGTLHVTGFCGRAPSSRSPYQAPELSSQPAVAVDRRADIYAMGAILYELAAGRVPGPAPVRPPSRVSSDCPPALDAVLLEALAAAPGGRFQTAAAFAQQLDEVLPRLGRSAAAVSLGPEPAAMPAPRRPAGPGKQALWAGGILAGALLVALALVLSAGSDPAPPVAAGSPFAAPSEQAGGEPPASLSPVEPASPSPRASVIRFEEAPPPARVDEAESAVDEQVDLGEVGEIPPARPPTGQERAINKRLNELVLDYDMAGVLAEAQRAVDALPESGWMLISLAKALMHQGRYWDAIEALDEAYVLDPGLVLVDPQFDKLARGVAKAQRDAPFDLDAPPPADAWRQLWGGVWQEEDGGTLVGSLAGWGPNSLSMLASTERLPDRGTLTVRIQLGQGKDLGLGSAGLALGQTDPEHTFLVMLAHMPALIERELRPGQVDAFRQQHGVYPKQLYLGRMRGYELDVLNHWTLPFPDSGWVELQVRLEGRALELKVGDWVQRTSLSGSAGGRWGLATMFQTHARFRDWEFTPKD